MLRAVLSGVVVFFLLLFLVGLFGGNVGPGELAIVLIISVAIAAVVRRRRRDS